MRNNVPGRGRGGRPEWTHLALHLARVVVAVLDWLSGDHGWW